MNSKELVSNALSGLPVLRIPSGPLAVHFCSRVAGVSIRDYTLNPRILADAVVKYYNKFLPDAVWISADTWVTAQAMGSTVFFPDEDQPLSGIGQPLIETGGDIEEIPLDNIIERGRIPVMIEALQLVKKAIGDHVFIVGCFDQSPFSLVCALMGIENAMMKMLTDRPFIESLLEKCITYCVTYGKALADAGADMLSTGDSPAGLIGEDLYRMIALPAEQKVFSALKSTGKYLSLHICGNATSILNDMAGCGADVLELDHQVEMEKACLIKNPEITLWGNIDPVAILEQADAVTTKAAINRVIDTVHSSNFSRFVLSSGCTLSMYTKEENLKILCESVKTSQ